MSSIDILPIVLSTERLVEIEERHAAATPGPWWCDQDENTWRLFAAGAALPPLYPGARVRPHGLQIVKAPKHGSPYAEYWPNDRDAELLAHAWGDIRDLLSQVRYLTQELQATRAPLGAVSRFSAWHVKLAARARKLCRSR